MKKKVVDSSELGDRVCSVTAGSTIDDVLHRQSQRLFHIAEILIWAGLIIWFCCILLAFKSDNFWFFVVGKAALLVGFLLRSKIRKRASALLSDYVAMTARDDMRPPILILRSFSQTELVQSRPRYHVRGGFSEEQGKTFLQELSEAVSPIARLVAIGAPSGEQNLQAPEALFFATTELMWFDVFSIVASSCLAVILIPDISEGVAREIQAIKKLGIEDKLIVFMPPTEEAPPSWTGVRIRENEKFAERWTLVRTKWKLKRYNLPRYDAEGMIYRAASDLSAIKAIGFERCLSVPNIHDALIQILPATTPNCKSLASIIGDIESIGAQVLSSQR